MRSQDFGFQGLGRIMFLANTEESFFVKVRSLKLDVDENNIFIRDYKQLKIKLGCWLYFDVRNVCT